MSNFIFIGPINRESAICDTVFRDVYDGNIANARHLDITSLFGFYRFLYHVLSNRSLRYALKKFPQLRAVLGRAANVMLAKSQEVKCRRLESLLDSAADNYIIHVPGLRFKLLPVSAIDTIRREYPQCRQVLYLVDSLERAVFRNQSCVEDILRYLEHFDAVYTYDRSDAELYSEHMRYIDIPLWCVSASSPSAQQFDLYFCGRNKNRGDLLMSIHRRLSDAGMRFRLQIAKDGEICGGHPDITQRSWIPYEETIADLRLSNCVLEVLAEHNSESTLRYKEAVMYNKKFLTTNQGIRDLPYYDPRWMRTFETAEDIDLDWLHAVEPVDYGYRGDYSVKTFLRRVEELTQSAEPQSKNAKT